MAYFVLIYHPFASSCGLTPQNYICTHIPTISLIVWLYPVKLQVMAGVAELLRAGMAALTAQTAASVQQLAAQNDALTLANRDLHAKVRNPLHVHWS